MQWLWVRILAGRALKERQCTLQGEARYVNVWSSVQWEGVHKVGECTLDEQIFLIIKIDQSEMTKSRMFIMSLRLTNHK